MNGNKAILDSNLLIFLSKNLIDRQKLYSRYDDFCVSIITYMEVYAFNFPDKDEKDSLDQTFANLEIIKLNQEIADQAITYRKNKSKKIKLPDAIILASAKYVNADLLTDDWDDFQNIDSTVNVKDIDDLKV
ncbi:MAG: PIN domain-containing protein [Pyrinomonadaceae bacterium]|nr:PIN domain-containing protein [Pyrinomonadaceae bacterium]